MAEPQNDERKAVEPTSAVPKTRRFAWLTFHFFVDVTTLLASIATVIALIFLIHDRRDQANIAAWTLLQTYLQQEHRAQFNQGQSFALETLASHGIDLHDIDAHGIVLADTNLRAVDAEEASFEHAQLVGVDLWSAALNGSNFKKSDMYSCNCRYASFSNANLTGASFRGGDYRDADFGFADVSDMTLAANQVDQDAFRNSCNRPGHPPHAFSSVPIDSPKHPQSDACLKVWSKSWDALAKAPDANAGGE